MDSIHGRLRKYRAQRGLTIKEVADLANLPVSTYKEWENGRQIRGEPYVVLSEIYQISLQELITGKKPPLNPALEMLDEISMALTTVTQKFEILVIPKLKRRCQTAS